MRCRTGALQGGVEFANRRYFLSVCAQCGRMLREKPAACFYIGQFFAESLLLAETGNSVGAIQIAGTAEASQMPLWMKGGVAATAQPIKSMVRKSDEQMRDERMTTAIRC